VLATAGARVEIEAAPGTTNESARSPSGPMGSHLSGKTGSLVELETVPQIKPDGVAFEVAWPVSTPQRSREKAKKGMGNIYSGGSAREWIVNA